MKDVGVSFMMRVVQRIILISILCFFLFGCSFLVKELHLSAPAEIWAEEPPTSGFEATVSTAYAVPNPYDGTSADLTVQLTATGTGAGRLYLYPGTVIIEKGTSVGTFNVSAIYDSLNPPLGPEFVTITARAIGYDEDSATITIIFP